jgi:6,7-dimethyl-8-ribityllumazine synthase
VKPNGTGDIHGVEGCHVIENAGFDTASRVAIVASRYHADIVQKLVDGAFAEVLANGIAVDRITLCVVPGAYELPMAAKRFASQNRYGAVITLGCVIRGETPHFDFVCAEASRGCTLVSLETNCPVAFGVLTVETREQALARAGGAVGNKGAESAAAALELAGMLKGIRTL